MVRKGPSERVVYRRFVREAMPWGEPQKRAVSLYDSLVEEGVEPADAADRIIEIDREEVLTSRVVETRYRRKTAGSNVEQRVSYSIAEILDNVPMKKEASDGEIDYWRDVVENESPDRCEEEMLCQYDELLDEGYDPVKAADVALGYSTENDAELNFCDPEDYLNNEPRDGLSRTVAEQARDGLLTAVLCCGPKKFVDETARTFAKHVLGWDIQIGGKLEVTVRENTSQGTVVELYRN
jgi:hypothetical protein